MRTLRASEIGIFLYCQRSWWYMRQGVETSNQSEMAAGTELHRQHSRRVMAAGLLKTVAALLFLAALAVLAVYLTHLWLG
jgi:CRISPR/Cas system-associated exonuclease Cas4 (RecB family)